MLFFFQLLRFCSLDTESVATLLTALLHSGTLDAGSDGGLPNDVGTYGFRFGDPTTRMLYIEGKGLVPGGSVSITSTRAELCGMFACLSFLRLLLEYAEIPPTTKLSCTIWCDSKAALARIQNLRYKRFGTTWRCRANYDIEAAIGSCIDRMSIELKFCWVRGHASNRLTAGQSLSWEETLNEESDRLATAARYLPINQTHEAWPEQRVCLFNMDGEMNGHLDHDLCYLCTASDLLNFLCDKYGWLDSIGARIELEGTARALKRLPAAGAIKVSKLRCGWLPVNTRVARQEVDRSPGCSACSSVGMTPESVDHLFLCPSPSRRSLLDKKCTSFNTKLRDLHTTKFIRRTLRYGMVAWLQGRVPHELSEFQLPDSQLGRLVARAYQEQTDIGWNFVFRGFLSQSWDDAQEFYLAQEHAKGVDIGRGAWDGTMWMASVISWIFEMFTEVWTQRNSDPGGTSQETTGTV